MSERLVERPVADADLREDRRVLWVTAGVFSGSFALGSVVQAAYVYAEIAPGWSAVDVWSRVAANLLAVLVLLGVLAVWRQHRRSDPVGLAVGIFLAALGGAGIRVLVQVVFGVYPDFTRATTPAEFASGYGVALLCCGYATWSMVVRRRNRSQARDAARLAVERALAVRALEDEEIRVRRDVAEGLHASVQQRLIVVVAQTAEVALRLRGRVASERDADVLDDVCGVLDEVREHDVRGLSRLLYPDQIDVGLVPATRALLRRVPTSVATRLDVDPAVRDLDDPASPVLSTTERLLALRVVEEGIGNALRHGRPTSIAVAISLDRSLLEVSVENDGGALPVSVRGSGTRRLAERLAVAGGTLELVGVGDDSVRLTGRLAVATARTAAVDSASDQPLNSDAGERNGHLGRPLGGET